MNPLPQQLLRIHALEQFIRNNRHPAQIRNLPAHLVNGVVGVHRPHRLNAAALLIAEEHGKRCHCWAPTDEWGGLRCEACSPGADEKTNRGVMTTPGSCSEHCSLMAQVTGAVQGQDQIDLLNPEGFRKPSLKSLRQPGIGIQRIGQGLELGLRLTVQ